MEARATCLIILASITASCCAIFNAFYQKRQFYSAIVYMTKSNCTLAVVYTQALVLVYLLAQLARKILFGQLRAAESEHVTERAWYAVTETCLAFTVFRDDFSPKFVAQFVLLLVLKCFHWLAEDRVDVMERSPVITVLFHARLMSVLGILALFDSYFVSHAYFQTLLRGASVQIVFGFEYAILMTIIFYVALKYILHSLDSRNVHPWENKAVYILYADFVVNMLRVTLYACFVSVMIKLHTFPLFSIRPMYLTLKAAKKAFQDIAMSRRAVNYLNNLYPNATQEELTQQSDPVCIICREEMTSGQAKKLPCNHIFHTSCLRSWFQRQQTCPTCRLDIIRETIIPPQAAPRVIPQQAQPAAAAPPAAHFIPPQFAQFFQPAPGAAPAAVPSAGPTIGPTFAAPSFFAPMPFPPMMGAPFLLPFPMAPNFSGFTDDEVRRMEENSRRGVESRILALRNIQTLLDAAVVQLQQYLTIMPHLPQPSPPPTGTWGSQPNENSSEEQSQQKSFSSDQVRFDLGGSKSSMGLPEKLGTPAGQMDENPENNWDNNASQLAGPSTAAPMSDSGPPIPNSPDDLRQKRLKHFSQNNINCNASANN